VMVRPSTPMPYLVSIMDDKSLVSDNGRCEWCAARVAAPGCSPGVWSASSLLLSSLLVHEDFFYSRVALSFCPKLV
jgi:hypothetical protein